MRLFSVLPLILCLLLVSSALAAQKKGVKTPAKTPDAPAEQIYLDAEVDFDPLEQFACDLDGIPISGIIQSFYPNGRLAWETQWVDGKLHGVTKGYYENRKLMEETTWVNGKLHGPARWYDEKGGLRRETMYEDDKDLSAPAGQGEDAQPPAARDDGAGEAPSAKDSTSPEAKQ
jgi:hypothetical protein